jgi:hypothetical protein
MSCRDEDSATGTSVAKGGHQQLVPFIDTPHVIEHKEELLIPDDIHESNDK